MHRILPEGYDTFLSVQPSELGLILAAQTDSSMEGSNKIAHKM